MRFSLQFGRFDLQVRMVLILLVLFLGILDLMNIFLLDRARRGLERAEEDRIEAVSRLLVSDLDRRALTEGLDAGDRFALPADLVLRRAAVRSGFDRVRILDPAGNPMASSSTRDDAGPSPLSLLDRDGRAALEAGRIMTVRVQRSGRSGSSSLAGFVPLLRNDGTLAGLVEVIHPVPQLASMESRFRTVLWVQLAGVLVIAALVVLFANWVSRPYRRMVAAAGEAGLTGGAGEGGAEPDELASAFRGVVEKLREQDLALEHLERGGAGLGDLVRFASRSATEMTTGVLVLDRRGKVAAMNDAAAAQLGVAREVYLGEDLAALEATLPDLVPLARACLRDGTAASREVLEVRRPDGGVGHLGVGLSPSPGTDGAPAGALVLMTDLTEIRQLQEQARLRENLVAVGKLSAGIAHEFRNALGTILGYARMLEKREDPRVRGPAGEILKEVDTVRRSVDEFLMFARPPEPESVVLDLEEVILACATTSPERIRVRVDGTFGAVLADRTLLKRVFENLLGNAADAARSAGRTVSVDIHGRPVAGGGIVQVEVEDDGPGIPRDELDQVFLPFYTTRSGGTGLGLALVQRTIVDVGGTVEAAAGPRGGALFRIRLPLRKDV